MKYRDVVRCEIFERMTICLSSYTHFMGHTVMRLDSSQTNRVDDTVDEKMGWEGVG